LGFIGYLEKQDRDADGRADEIVRIFLECRDSSSSGESLETGAQQTEGVPLGISYTYAVDVIFPGGKPPCRFQGIKGVLVLKKFYKLVHSLEERAREHGNFRTQAMESVHDLVEHLGYTRNARNFTGFQTSGGGEA
jgi:hypothetical protein